MKQVMMLVALLAVAACSSGKSAPAPVISNFTLTSPLPAGTTTVSGNLDVTDTGGLGDVTLTIGISGNGVAQPLPPSPVQGGSSTVTTAMIPMSLTLSTAIPAGTYEVTVTLTDDGVTSNQLSAQLVVQ